MPRALALVAVLLLGCPKRGPVTGLGDTRRVQLVNTLPAFVQRLDAAEPQGTEAVMRAWRADEAEHEAWLQAARATPDDPGDNALRKQAVSPSTVLALARAFDADAPGEANALVKDIGRLFGGEPELTVVFTALRAGPPMHPGQWQGRALLLFNALSPELSEPVARQTALAHALYTALHRQRQGDGSLGPVARALYREGAAALATRQLVPRALEHQVLGVTPETLERLKAREALMAKELLASLDSGRESEAARFFSADVKDPLLPRGAGRFLADRVFQQLAERMGSAHKPLKLSAAEFSGMARAALLQLSSRG